MSSTHRGHVGKDAAHPAAALAMLLKFKWRFHHGAGTALVAAAVMPKSTLLAVPLFQLRLVVERVHLADAAVHEQLHDRASLWPGDATRR
jgi:hypothetical protein